MISPEHRDQLAEIIAGFGRTIAATQDRELEKVGAALLSIAGAVCCGPAAVDRMSEVMSKFTKDELTSLHPERN